MSNTARPPLAAAIQHAHSYDGQTADGRQLPTPSAGWTGTGVRLLFGVIWGIDAYLKWLPGYRHSYIANLKMAAQGQPSFLHGWFTSGSACSPAPQPCSRS